MISSPVTENTEDVDILLEKIRVNSILLSNAHKERYVELKSSLKYYKIPVIVISGISALISVAQAFIPQDIITICNGLFGLSCSIIVSIELYLGISAQLAQSASLTKEFYSLSTDIYKTLSLSNENRTENSLTYLESIYGTYTSLCANSYIIVKQLDDQLLVLPAPEIISDRRGSTTSLLNFFTHSTPSTPNRRSSLTLPTPNRRSSLALPTHHGSRDIENADTLVPSFRPKITTNFSSSAEIFNRSQHLKSSPPTLDPLNISSSTIPSIDPVNVFKSLEHVDIIPAVKISRGSLTGVGTFFGSVKPRSFIDVSELHSAKSIDDAIKHRSSVNDGATSSFIDVAELSSMKLTNLLVSEKDDEGLAKIEISSQSTVNFDEITSTDVTTPVKSTESDVLDALLAKWTIMENDQTTTETEQQDTSS